MTQFIREPAKDLPVAAQADLCVAGGSCTGVFAAVRAARLGLSVVLCERAGIPGGTATQGLVNIWHAVTDIDDREPVIAGLTSEVLDRLDRSGALLRQPLRTERYNFNPAELVMELDGLIRENRVRLLLHTLVCGAVEQDGSVRAVIVENGDGRQAIRADFFIDCTGDGVLAERLGVPSYSAARRQPPTCCFHLQGSLEDVDVGALTAAHGQEFGLPDAWGWGTAVAGCEGLSMRAESRVFGVNCERAADLTAAETEGRRQVLAYVRLLQKYGRRDTHYAMMNLASSIGVREALHYKTIFQAAERPLLTGARYDDPILQGTYPVDIHHAEDNGLTWRHLDGRQVTVWGKESRREERNWREDLHLSGPYAKFYQVPFELLVGAKYRNFIAAGRMLNADEGAFGALRVMVNLNQLGEAAGAAAALCLAQGCALQALDGRQVTAALRKGGSAL